MNFSRSFHAIVLVLLAIAFAAPTSEAQTVYITRTGSKYHKAGCQYLRKSQNAIAIEDAASRGYAPCRVCEPGSPSQEKKTKKPADATQGKNNTTGTSKVSPARTSPVRSRQCTATTKAGTRCKRVTTSASGKCYQHE